MKCPICNAELKESIEKVKWTTQFGTSRASKSARTKLKRVFKCDNCNKYFTPRLILQETRLANSTKNGGELK